MRKSMLYYVCKKEEVHNMKKNFTNKQKAYNYFEEMANKGYAPTIRKTPKGWVVIY